MSTWISQADESNALTRFRDRCRELGLPVWCWDDDDVITAEPESSTDAGEWLRAPLLRDWLRNSKTKWGTDSEPTVEELMPGCWLLPIVNDYFYESRCHSAVMVLTPEALQAVQFEAICLSAGLNTAECRNAMKPLTRHSTEDVESLSRVVGWLYTDQIKLAEDELTINGFSKQLVDTYEQMSLLYRVADSLNAPSDPHSYVKMACELLHSTLDYQWIALRFTKLPTLGRVLANELVLIGEIPCSHTRYDKIAGELANLSSPEQRPTVLEPESNKLAALVESDVFANPLISDNKLAGMLMAGNKGGHDPDVSTMDMQLISATADYLSAYLHNTALYHEQRTTFLGIVKALSASIDAKDRYTRGHSERVAHLASSLALAIGMSDEQADRIRLSGLLHDVGKIGVPEAVLLKAGKLTPKEFDAIKLHPTIGFNILREIEPLQDVLPGVLHHHERWDGGGYPHGIKGEEIPLIARLVAVADTFDAMSSNRSYRSAVPRSKVLAEIRTNAGSQFDPQLAKRFVTLDLGEYDRLVSRHKDKEKENRAA